jgi:hypothetical protein
LALQTLFARPYSRLLTGVKAAPQADIVRGSFYRLDVDASNEKEREMRRVVAAEYLSLDGVTEDPGPAGEFEHRGWTMPYWNAELSKYQTDQLFASGDFCWGGSPTTSLSPRGH